METWVGFENVGPVHALKEYLMPLANNMTCAGNLIDFNSGGYKALSRSLNIQVSFTETTLFTPRRCFDRAAENLQLPLFAIFKN